MSEPERDAGPPPPPGADSGGAEMYALLYAELRAMAHRELEGERAGHTLSATGLVHEAYLRLFKSAPGAESSVAQASAERARFFALAAQVMRRVLIDHARSRGREKRGGDRVRVSSEQMAEPVGADEPAIDAIVLDEALVELEREHPEAARVVELRFFAGLPESAIGPLLGVSERTVRRHWVFAKAYLTRALRQSDGAVGGEREEAG